MKLTARLSSSMLGLIIMAQYDPKAEPELWREVDLTRRTDSKGTITNAGDLDLEAVQLEELPDDMTVEGNLNLRDSAIKKWPKNLTVFGDVNVEGTALSGSKPPKDAKIHGVTTV